jgi:hypothetical protein
MLAIRPRPVQALRSSARFTAATSRMSSRRSRPAREPARAGRGGDTEGSGSAFQCRRQGQAGRSADPPEKYAEGGRATAVRPFVGRHSAAGSGASGWNGSRTKFSTALAGIRRFAMSEMKRSCRRLANPPAVRICGSVVPSRGRRQALGGWVLCRPVNPARTPLRTGLEIVVREHAMMTRSSRMASGISSGGRQRALVPFVDAPAQASERRSPQCRCGLRPKLSARARTSRGRGQKLPVDPGFTPADRPVGGQLNAAISRALVRIHLEYLGRGPSQIRTFLRENTGDRVHEVQSDRPRARVRGAAVRARDGRARGALNGANA